MKVTAVPYEESALINVMLPPEADGTADYDMFIWGWSWGLDPSSPLEVFLCDAIGGSSDSLWCDEKFDDLYDEQHKLGGEERHAVLDEIQQYWYDQAPYHILYYDDNLHAYRTDKFSNWQRATVHGHPALRLQQPELHPARAGRGRVGQPVGRAVGWRQRCPGDAGTVGRRQRGPGQQRQHAADRRPRRRGRGGRRRTRPGAAPQGRPRTTSSLDIRPSHDLHGGEPVPGSPRLT